MASFKRCVRLLTYLFTCLLSILIVWLSGVYPRHPVIDTQVSGLEVILQTSDERISKLELQVASKAAEIAAKVVQVDNLEKSIKRTVKGASLMLAAIHEHGPQLRAADAACSSPEAVLQ